MRRWGAVVVAALVVVATRSTPVAAQAGERIVAIDVEISVERSGDLRVVETIDYDFGAEDRHGIVRTIPTRFHHDETYDRVYPLDEVTVDAERGTPDDVEVSEDGGVTSIRIGDPDRTIRGRHRYRVAYRVRGAINAFDDHDELYWNAIGTEWTVPIEQARVVVRTPLPVSRIACFAGPQGSSLPCAAARAQGRQAEFAHRPLSAYEGVAVVVAVPPGTVAEPGPVLRERFSLRRAFAVTPTTASLALIVLLAGLGAVARLSWRTGRDRRYVGEVPGLTPPAGAPELVEHRPLFTDAAGPVEYSPPPGMKPALMGVLVDERADPLDVTATIVDLAVRRHLRIDEIPKKWFWSRPDWRLTRLDPAPDDELATWERTLLTALFDDGATVELSDLKDRFYRDLAAIQRQLYDDAMARGWFTRHPDKQRGLWFGVGAVATGAGAGVTALLAKHTHHALIGVPLVICGLVLLALHRRMPARTGRGSAALAQALGFRRYLSTAEAHQLRYEEDAGVFARYLPYAVVLGETKRWARAFERLGATPQQQATYWYGGSGDFSPSHFAESISTFSTMSAGTVASTPGSSGSSGFSGGSSGGGGGGGGGGSW